MTVISAVGGAGLISDGAPAAVGVIGHPPVVAREPGREGADAHAC